MTNEAATTSAFPDNLKGVRRAFFVAALEAAAADWLFYDRALGISVAVFILLVAAGVAIANPARVSPKASLIAIGILSASILPIVESLGILSLLSGITGIAIYTLIMVGEFSGNIIDRISRITWQLASGPFQLGSVLIKIRQHRQQTGTVVISRGNALSWAVPVGLGFIFLLLFRSANPVIESWIDVEDIYDLFRALDFARVLFWAIAVGVVWSFVRVRVRSKVNSAVTTADTLTAKVAGTASRYLFGMAAVLRSLLLFNALFAIQTVLDIAFLWGGASLPDGMTYASYAHRGAYPLVVTALLAGAFLLIAMRPGSATEASSPIRALVYLWTGQNVVLVISSMWRLNLYIEVFSLTNLRVAAFIWMFLVAGGLILIVARIAFKNSNTWLISKNTVMLAATLYICAYINFPYFIAQYNVTHSREFGGGGVGLDTRYLCSLGPQAYPAVKENLAPHMSAWDRYNSCARGQINLLQDQINDWRGWSYRSQRLMQYLGV